MALESLNDLRARIVAGEDVPKEEMAAAITMLRDNRMAASRASAEKRTRTAKAKPQPIDLNSLFGDK